MFSREDVIQAPDGQLWWVAENQGIGLNSYSLVAMASPKAYEEPHRGMWVARSIPRDWVNSPMAAGVQIMDISAWKRVGTFKRKKAASVVSQFDWTAVKETIDPSRAGWSARSYDVWEWNLFKMKWVRLSNTACGFGKKADADLCAKERSDEIDQMLKNNAAAPAPLK